MQQEKMTPLESITIIEDAIKKATQETTGAAYYHILWGSLIFIYALCTYCALTIPETAPVLSMSWLVFPIGGLLSYLHAKKTDKIEQTKPLNDSLYSYVWGGVGLCLGIFCSFGMASGAMNHIAPVAMILFGFASFVTGGVTGFRPSLIGSIICILLAGPAINMESANQCLLGAAGVLSGNIIPGIMMNLKKK